jgi:hypothetical protein
MGKNLIGATAVGVNSPNAFGTGELERHKVPSSIFALAVEHSGPGNL